MSEARTVLVTGGAGYVGSHACKALAAAGWRPVVYDDLSRGHRWAVKWGPLVQGGLHDIAALTDALRTHRPWGVLHFAALALISESNRMPRRYWHANVEGTRCLLEAMRAAEVRRLVFSSTCSIYGNAGTPPFTEASPPDPINVYAETKLAAERLIRATAEAEGLQAVTLRYFNAAGADPDGELGEVHDPETHVVPLLLEAALGRRAGFALNGTDYPTPDGTCLRDYVHVADLAEAHAAALAALEGGGLPPLVNLGTGRAVSIRELIGHAEAVSGRAIPVTEGPRRPGDPAHLVADAALARAVLGWQPRHSDLRTILESAWRWHSELEPQVDSTTA
jgi:UDP-glucose-4-epimerase GalE